MKILLSLFKKSKPQPKRGWVKVGMDDALSISLKFGYNRVAWGSW